MKNAMYPTSLWAITAILVLPLTCAAQYRNSATGQTYNNSYSAMLSVTSTMMQNFNTQQQRYISNTSKLAATYAPNSNTAQPFTAQQAPGQALYPITATDFPSAARRELPARLAQSMQGLSPQQKYALQQMYGQLLSEYEKTNRQRNIAAAIAYAVRVSLEIDRGRKLSVVESNTMIQALNNALAIDPQFNALTSQEKQVLYESLILTGEMAAVLCVEGRTQRNATFELQAREIAQSVLKQWAGI